MILITASVLLGFAIGLVRRGSFANLATRRGRLAPFVALGLILAAAPSVWDQFASEPLPGAIWIYLAGLALLVVAAVANARQIKGAAIAGLGLFANVAVASINGYVPVREEALRAAVERLNQPGRIVIDGGLWALETPDTVLGILGDVIPLPLLEDVVSFGDLITLAGICVIVQNLMLRQGPQGISVDEFLADTTVDLRSIVDVRDPITAPAGNAPSSDAGSSNAASSNGSDSEAAPAPKTSRRAARKAAKKAAKSPEPVHAMTNMAPADNPATAADEGLVDIRPVAQSKD